ncbi:MAG TPA: hypothetical protein VFX92_06050 [Candidatus Krumholzibacteria bacterium]|nr:hypothetical protein [Candidatus Krumholzibacteria bacterium]
MRVTFAVAALVAVAVQAPRAAGNERIASGNWSYPAVERFETLGYCTLPEDRPFSRHEFAALVATIADNAAGADLSARDRYELDRLVREYGTGSAPGPRERYDRSWFVEDDPLAAEADVTVYPYLQQAPFSSEAEAYVGIDPEFRLHVGERVTYEVRYQLLYGPEHGDRARNQKPSRREKSFKGLTALFDRSYVLTAWDHIHLLVGRDYVDWGPSADGGLIVPGERYSIDQIGARVFFKMFRFDFFYGQLFTDPERYLVGHRLEATFGRTVVGLSETVTYGGRGPDMLYALPVAWFYANQFNERTNSDNILWAVDAKTTPLDGITLYGSMLIDDFQFERDEGYPDKLALEGGFRFVPARPLGLALRGRYRRIGTYTYSHTDSLSVYVSGGAEIDAGDTLLGGEPGGDADAWRLDADVFPRAQLRVNLAAFGTRLGEGNPIRVFTLGSDDPTPPFPSGLVRKTTGFAVGARWEFDNDRWVGAEYSHQTASNAGGVDGADDSSDAFRVEIRWDMP